MPDLLVILLLFASVSCHRKSAPPAVSAPERSERTDIQSFLDLGPYDWTLFSCSGEIDMNASMFSGSGQYILRMRKDSVLWAVVRYIGIEVARIQADQDSLVILNRFEQTVDVYSWEEVKAKTGFPASLEALQRTVLGWLPYVPGAVQVIRSDSNEVDVLGKEGRIQVQATLAEPNLLPTSCLYRDTGSGMTAKGTQMLLSDTIVAAVPAERTWEMKQDEKSRLFLQIHVENPSFTGPLSFPFEIPDRYARH